jgi:hypothetical protein
MLYPITNAVDTMGDLIGEFDGKLGKAGRSFKIFGNTAKTTGAATEAAANGLELVNTASIKTGRSVAKTGVITKAFNAASLGLNKTTRFAAKGMTVMAGAGSAVSAALGTATTTVIGFLTAAAPFVAIGAAIAGALALIAKVIGNLVPSFGKMFDANIRATESLKEFNKELEYQTNALAEFNKEFFVNKEFDIDTEPAKRSIEEIRQLRKEYLATLTVEEKAFAQGIRGMGLDALEAIDNFALGATQTVTKLGLKISQLISNAFTFFQARDQINAFYENIFFNIDEQNKKEEQKIRERFNRFRESVQSGIRADQMLQINRVRVLLNEQALGQIKVIDAYKEGTAATEEGINLLNRAASEGRSLTAKELIRLQATEKEYFEAVKENNNSQIAFLQEKLEKTKDPVLQGVYQQEIDKINERNQSLEESIKLVEEYRNNIQALLKVVEQNNAARGVENLREQINNLYEDLGPEARRNFAEFFNAEFSVQVNFDKEAADFALQDAKETRDAINKVIDEQQEAGNVTTFGGLQMDLTGNILDVAGFKNQLEVDFEEIGLAVSTSAERLRTGALLTAQATLQQSIEDINNPERGVTQDTLATNLFNTLDAIGDAYPKEADKLAAIINATNQNINIDGIDAQLRDILKPKDLEALSQQIVEITGTTNNQVIAENKAAVEQINSLENSKTLTVKEAIIQRAELEEQNNQLTIDSKKAQLKALEQAEMENTEIYKALVLEVATLEIQADEEVFKNKKKLLDAELAELQLQKDNEFEIIKQGFEREQALNEFRTKSINLEQQSLSAQKDLSEAITNLENSRLQNKLKLTGDIEEKARIETELAERRLSTLDAEQEYERVNLELQQELNKLTLEREKSTLRQTKAQLESNLVMAEAKLANAEALNLTEDETKALQLQVDALNQQIAVNNTQQGQLERQGQIQDQINEKQKTSLDLKQQAAKEQAATEVELAQIAEINAFYEKQKQQIQNNARETKLAGEERVNNLKAQSDILDQQTKILEKQFEIIKDTNALVERYYSLAKDQASTGLRQRRLEREAAKTQRDNLEQMQRIERSNLKIKQAQRDIALEIREIELESSLADQQATRAQAQADLAALQANPNASAEQIRAAELSVVAADQGIEGILRQLGLVDVERNFNESLDRMEQMQMQQNQNFESLAADARVADTTLTRGDDARISRQAQRAARENNEQLESLANTFERSMSGLQNSLNQTTTQLNPTGGSGTTMSSLSGRLNQNLSSANSAAPVSINGQVNLTVDIKGNTEGIDKSGLETKIADGFYRSFNELLDYSIRKQGS